MVVFVSMNNTLKVLYLPKFFLVVGFGIGGSDMPDQREPRKILSNEYIFAAISEERQLFQKLCKHLDGG